VVAVSLKKKKTAAVTREDMRENLPEPHSFASGDEVAVRLAFERGSPTVALTARVEQADAGAGVVECSLVWNAPESERKQLDAWLTRAS
jgi:hypothetical protein